MTEKKARIVQMFGDINPESISRVSKEILELWSENPSEEITLYLASHGGSVLSSIAFYDFIKIFRINLTVVGLGVIDSAAIEVWLAGRKRKVSKNTSFLLHEISKFFKEEKFTPTETEKELRDMNILQKIKCRIIAEAAGKSEEVVIETMKRGCRMTLEEAIEFGLLKKDDVLE